MATGGIDAGRGGDAGGVIEGGGCGAGRGGGLAGGSGGRPPTGNAPEGRPPPYVEIPGVPTGVGIDDARGGGAGGETDAADGITGVARVAGCAIGGVRALPKCWDVASAAAGGRGGALGIVVPATGVGAADAPSRDTVITPPHTAHRARTLAPGMRPGSTRNTERHSGQLTFINGAPPPPLRLGRSPRARPGDRRHPAYCRCVGRSRTLIRAASWRSSSFPLRVRSPVPRA
jgi:hypothetical protein